MSQEIQTETFRENAVYGVESSNRVKISQYINCGMFYPGTVNSFLENS